MGLIDRVKNFFEEKEEKPSDISLEKAKELLENNLKENEKVVLSEASSKITSIKHLLNEINLDIQGIEKRDLMEEGDNKYLRKIVSTAQKNMVMQMSGLVQKLGPNTIIDAAGMKNYAKESTETMQKEILSFRKNITYTGVIMKDEMKNIGLMLQKLMKKYGEINELFDKSNIKKFMVIKDKLNELDKTEDTEKKKKTEVNGLKEALEKKEGELTEKEGKIKKLMTSGEYKRIAEINQKMSELNDEHEHALSEFYGTLSKADKVIRRFIGICDAGLYILNNSDKELLNDYMNSPKEAAKKDPKAEKFKALLTEMKKAVDERKIKLKDKEKEKRLKALDELLAYDYFTNLFWKFNKTEAEKAKLNKELSVIDVAQQIKAEAAEIKEINKKREENKERLNAVEDELKVINKEKQKICEEINNGFTETFNKKVIF